MATPAPKDSSKAARERVRMRAPCMWVVNVLRKAQKRAASLDRSADGDKPESPAAGSVTAYVAVVLAVLLAPVRAVQNRRRARSASLYGQSRPSSRLRRR